MTCAACTHSYAETALYCPNCGRPKERDAVGDALLGKVLGERFQVLELIGQGGSGTIYRGEHVTLRRKVALKVLHNELSRDDLAVERFRREATTVAEIDNEHIVEIHDFGRTPDGRLYLAMELLDGETLDHILLRDKQLSVERTADILIQVGEALMEAHAIGYVHRDLRPRNIYLANRRGRANFVKLLDFGLAKLVETDSSAASTSLGMTFGDPRYMSPEQARGDRIDRRADIYQLGCVAYEMLTGAPPFSGNRVFDILTKQVTETPVPLPTRRPGVPLWMEAAVTKMLAKDPENRFATTTRMVEALRRGLDTGEVMEADVARRRESIPPPSVSRVMQKMGISQPVDTPVPMPAAPAAAATPAETNRGIVASPDAPAPTRTVKPAVPDSVELLRKRTGTPRIGVPVVAPSERTEEQAPVAGVIEQEIAKPATPRGKSAPAAEPNISQVWYDDDDDAPRARAKAKHSPSTTDLVYDELPPRSSKLPRIVGALGLLAIGGVAFALTRGGSSTPSEPTPPPIAQGAITADAAPSQFLEPIDAAPAVVAEAPRPPATRPTPTGGTRSASPAAPSAGVGTTKKPPTGANDTFVLGGGDVPFRRPGGSPTAPSTGSTTDAGTTTVTGTTPAPKVDPKPEPKPTGIGDGPS
ncbi:MAG TPA: serine/threonine-protein kinase, partial [Kofleriaceae bacterium]|nr:serine/threonine-protein kinase [Kofleriaceae bacterium]